MARFRKFLVVAVILAAFAVASGCGGKSYKAPTNPSTTPSPGY